MPLKHRNTEILCLSVSVAAYICSMQVDYLLIGQGISGTWLSYYLQKESKSFLVIDNNAPASSSRIAAGIINPVTGRRYVEVWIADEILPFAWKAYHELAAHLNITAISPKNIIDFFPTPQMRLSFMQRIEQGAEYVFNYPDQNKFISEFNYEFGCGEIKPVYITHPETLLPAWRKKLVEQNCLRQEEFDINELSVAVDSIIYKDITANKIIFCDGSSGALNPYFEQLPFAPNKGQALLVHIPGLPDNYIYKKGIMLLPYGFPEHCCAGPSYEWEFNDLNPTADFRQKTESLLKNWLKLPFRITDHLAGLRPATLERRPFVGLHPLHHSVGILNGMGTKGCSLAPYFAKQFADHLCYGKTLKPEADIKRFQKILSRNKP